MLLLLQDLNPGQLERRVVKMPSPLEYLSFVFCLGNLLGGPYLEYSDYHQFMESTGVRICWRGVVSTVLLPC